MARLWQCRSSCLGSKLAQIGSFVPQTAPDTGLGNSLYERAPVKRDRGLPATTLHVIQHRVNAKTDILAPMLGAIVGDIVGPVNEFDNRRSVVVGT